MVDLPPPNTDVNFAMERAVVAVRRFVAVSGCGYRDLTVPPQMATSDFHARQDQGSSNLKYRLVEIPSMKFIVPF